MRGREGGEIRDGQVGSEKKRGEWKGRKNGGEENKDIK